MSAEAVTPSPSTPHSEWWPYGVLAPALLLVVAVSFLPLGYSFVQSLYRSRYLDLGQFVGLDNYYNFLLSPDGLKRVKNSLVYVAGSLALTIPLGFALALLLNKQFAFRGVFRTILVVPWLVSNTVASLLWAWILNEQFGPLSYAAKQVGLNLPNALTHQILAMPAIILCNAWGSYPLTMVFILAALQGVPRELYEAAKIDGANQWQTFRYITFPIVQNTTLVTVVLTTLHAFNGVTIAFIMTGGGPIGATDMMALNIFNEGFRYYRMGTATAGAVIVFGINLLFTLAYIRVLKERGN